MSVIKFIEADSIFFAAQKLFPVNTVTIQQCVANTQRKHCTTSPVQRKSTAGTEARFSVSKIDMI